MIKVSECSWKELCKFSAKVVGKGFTPSSEEHLYMRSNLTPGKRQILYKGKLMSADMAIAMHTGKLDFNSEIFEFEETCECMWESTSGSVLKTWKYAKGRHYLESSGNHEYIQYFDDNIAWTQVDYVKTTLHDDLAKTVLEGIPALEWPLNANVSCNGGNIELTGYIPAAFIPEEDIEDEIIRARASKVWEIVRKLLY
jgi:hypothetical protein